MKTHNRHPKRFSFTEVKSMLNGTQGQDAILRLAGRDLGIIHGRHVGFNNFLQPGIPYIIEDCRIGFVKNGEARITVNLMEHTAKKGTLAYIGTGSIIQISRLSPDFDLFGMMVGAERFRMAMNGNIPALYDRNACSFMLAPTPGDVLPATMMIRAAWVLAGRNDCPDEALNGIIHALAHYYARLKENSEGTQPESKTHGRIMFDKFIQLVNAHCKKERSLAFYADAMCVTPRYLGAVVKAISGVTAKEWIDRAVVTNAKVMLRYDNITAAGVADRLDFPNPSFFNKFFKRMTGMTPQAYRFRKPDAIDDTK